MFRRDLRSENYELISPDTPLNTPKPVYATADARSASSNQLPSRYLGRPRRKQVFDLIDCISVLLCLICLAIAISVISPSLKYAAEFGYTKQIIILGFVLGIMNQCLQRVTPHLFILLEARFGSSSIQNFDGLLRWAPLAERLGIVWRIMLIMLLLLPLGLGVVYKRFTGGIGIIETNDAALYSPTVPYGLLNTGPIAAIANATGPFMAASGDDNVPDFSNPQSFGYNIILLSNDSAAAVDAPSQQYVKQLQQDLQFETVFNLTAKVRATVATLNLTVETHRNDQAFWKKYFGLMYLQSTPLLNPNANATRIGLLNLLSAATNNAANWDASWAFLGLYNGNGSDIPDRPAFERSALGFDVKRHECDVTWSITRNSMELIAGRCDAEPMAWQYQYLENCEFFLSGEYFLPFLGECLNSFAGPRNQSLWRIPTFAVVTATAFWSRVALQRGYVGVQPAGPIYNYWIQPNSTMQKQPGQNWFYNETYSVNHQLLQFVPTLEPAASLYMVIAFQPFLTVVAFIAAVMMFKTPIGRGFGMVAVLAGIDKDSLTQLSGAGFSGQVSRSIGMRIRVKRQDFQDQNSEHRVEYVLGQKGNTGSMKLGIKYC